MTAPVYEDQNSVDGFTLADFRKIIKEAETDSLVQRVATATVTIWKSRDQARGTAALQDAAIHKQLPRTHAMEKCVKVLRWFANANEENHMDRCFWCSSHIVEEGHADPCGVVDAKKVLEELDKT